MLSGKKKKNRNNSFSSISTVEGRKIRLFLRLAWIDPKKTCKETIEANKSGYWGGGARNVSQIVCLENKMKFKMNTTTNNFRL